MSKREAERVACRLVDMTASELQDYLDGEVLTETMRDAVYKAQAGCSALCRDEHVGEIVSILSKRARAF